MMGGVFLLALQRHWCAECAHRGRPSRDGAETQSSLSPEHITSSGDGEDVKLLIFFYQSQCASFLRYIIILKKTEKIFCHALSSGGFFSFINLHIIVVSLGGILDLMTYNMWNHF